MEFIHLFTLFMTILISNTASRNHVFVRTGDSVKLDIKNKIPPFIRFAWINDKSDNVVKCLNQSGEFKLHSSFKDRVDFDIKTFSLTLKNMNKTHSGIYTAKAIGHQETIVAKHNVSVIDPVDSPVLNWNTTMISVNSCIVNVSCRGHILTLSTSFHSNNCSQVEETSSEMQNLTLHCIENIVVCNYSNPVSWKNDTLEINQLCTPHEHTSTENPKETNSSFPLHWLLIIVVVLLMVFAAVSVICCFYYRNKKHKKGVQVENDHTVYAQVQLKKKEQRPLEMLEKSVNPQTVYGFTGEHSQNRPCPEIRTQAQTENQPRTTYSTIGQHKKTSFQHHPTETEHTIYSIVCKSSQGRQPGHS